MGLNIVGKPDTLEIGLDHDPCPLFETLPQASAMRLEAQNRRE
jgi:hypothetical protein